MPRHVLPTTFYLLIVYLLIVCGIGRPALANDRPTAAEAAEALAKATTFFREQVSSEGGYLWRYSSDLTLREGERAVGAKTVWVQPPGTPSVGEAYLQVYHLTGDPQYLEAARETAMALVRGQLQSGGWDYRIEFDPDARRRYAYRVDAASDPKARNVTTLDDNTTQSALQFLMHVDEALGQNDDAIHEAAQYALQSLLKAQYPNGGWPQRYSDFPDPEEYPVLAAGYPDQWSRTYPARDYQAHYTFNDNSLADVIVTMFEAARIYRQPRYAEAAERGGDFILLAQMPEPQPAWAQQYNRQMHPAWARKFEPPAITGGESQGLLRTLMQLYQETGKTKYLDAVAPALAYLKRSELSDGRLARFYELKTNRPLFFTRQYELTYSSDDLPTHYGFLVDSRLDQLEAQYQRLQRQPVPAGGSSRETRREVPRLTDQLAEQVRQVIDRQDERGAWLTAGRLRDHRKASDEQIDEQIIETAVYLDRIKLLASYIAALSE